LAKQVEAYANTSDMSVSKAVAALVRLGLESHEGRKREFFKRLKRNLANNDPKIEDQMMDEFRSLILGR
jgi:glucose-6-phosphate-specific signal transduction histidine kinase